MKYFAHVKPDGSVHISGGLLFYPGGFLKAEEAPAPTDREPHSFTGVSVWTKLPRWWEVRLWWRILQEIRAVMRSDKPAVF